MNNGLAKLPNVPAPAKFIAGMRGPVFPKAWLALGAVIGGTGLADVLATAAPAARKMLGPPRQTIVEDRKMPELAAASRCRITPVSALAAISVLLSACHGATHNASPTTPTSQPMKWDTGQWDSSDWS